MTEQHFSLIPFPAQDVPEITIKGRVARQDNILAIHYSLAGAIGCIFLPSPTTDPTRKNELWKWTCFEFFIAVKELPQYWEFNLSPSGDWNVYVMDAYRQVNMREETRIQRLQFEVRNETDHLCLDAAIDLNPILETEKAIEAGIATVIRSNDGRETYWALVHPRSEADFHLRAGFIIKF